MDDAVRPVAREDRGVECFSKLVGGEDDLPVDFLRMVASACPLCSIVVRKKKTSEEGTGLHCVFVSPAARLLTGCFEKSAIDEDLAGLLPGLSEGGLLRFLAALDNSSGTLEFCWQERVPGETETRWLHMRARAPVGEMLVLLISDCSEKVALYRDLRQKSGLYRAICESVPFGIMHIDCSDLQSNSVMVRNINPAARTFLNIPDKDLSVCPDGKVSTELQKIFRRSLYDDLILHIATSVDQGATTGIEVTFSDDGGVPRSYEFMFSPIFVGGGIPAMVLCLIFDETEKRCAEQATGQSQRLQAIGQLTGGIAHDFNNRLTVITGNLELLERRLQSDPEGLKLLHEAISSAFSSSHLTQQLLAFSRRQALNPAKMNANDKIDDIARMLERSLGEQVCIEMDLAGDLWPVHVDVPNFEAAIVNFALNARDAMPHGGVMRFTTRNVCVTGRETGWFPNVEPGAYVRIDVGDTGEGIPADILPHVMEPFFTTKGVGKGTGLGLSSAYGFARQSHGDLHVASEAGIGTTISLLLPRYGTVTETREPSVCSGGEIVVDDSARGSGETVLVVEDDSQLRKLVGSMLEGIGYRVVDADNADHALETLAAEAEDIDLAFVDNIMPGGMNGVDLMAKIHERYPRIEVVLTTGYSSALSDPGVHIPAGIPVLAKPYKLASLAQVIQEALAGRSCGASGGGI